MVEPEFRQVPRPLVQAEVQAPAREEEEGEGQEGQGGHQKGERGAKGKEGGGGGRGDVPSVAEPEKSLKEGSSSATRLHCMKCCMFLC